MAMSPVRVKVQFLLRSQTYKYSYVDVCTWWPWYQHIKRTCVLSMIVIFCFYVSTTSQQETDQEMTDPNMTSLYFATRLAFNAPTEGFPWDDLRKILHGVQFCSKDGKGSQEALL